METPAENVVLNYLGKRAPEERAEMARLLTDTMNSPGWTVYMDLLDVRVKGARFLTESWQGVPPYEEMVNHAATLRGLLTAQSIPGAVIEAGDRANEELRQIAKALEASQ